MSAKVFKKESAAVVFDSFFIPEMATDDLPAETNENFAFAETSDFDSAPGIAETESLESPDEILQSAREEAAQIIAQAERDREMIEQAAREKAEQEASAIIENQIAERTGEIRTSFAETLQQLSVLREEISARVETDLVELALEIAKKIVGREVTVDREIALTLVKVSLKKLNSRAPFAQIHLSPEDYAFIDARREQIDFRGSLELIEDRSISPGGCLVHTDTGEVDARIESQFEEIAHGLLGK